MTAKEKACKEQKQKQLTCVLSFLFQWSVNCEGITLRVRLGFLCGLLCNQHKDVEGNSEAHKQISVQSPNKQQQQRQSQLILDHRHGQLTPCTHATVFVGLHLHDNRLMQQFISQRPTRNDSDKLLCWIRCRCRIITCCQVWPIQHPLRVARRRKR